MTWLVIHIPLVLLALYTLFGDHRSKSGVLSWFYFIMLFPILGPIIFLLFGSTKVKDLTYNFSQLDVVKTKPSLDLPRELALISKLSNIQPTFNNKIALKGNQEDCLETIKNNLLKAEKYVFLEYYIILDDEIGNQLLSILADISKKNIKVYVLYDWYGSFFINRRKLKELKKNGATTHPFYPIYNVFRKRNPNLRNHRKLIVIDGKYAISGSANLGNRYLKLKLKKPKSSNKDYFLFLEGDLCKQLDEMFRKDWWHVTGKTIEVKASVRSKVSPEPAKPQPLQLIPSGPNDEADVLQQAIFSILASAKESITLVTPYFVPTESLVMALKYKAQSGVKVEVLVPKRSDNWLVDLAARTFYRELKKYGIKIREYSQNFLHFKCIKIDKKSCLLGTFNLDTRSLLLNYEVSFLIYDSATIRQLDKEIEGIRAHSKLHESVLGKKAIIAENIARAWSPLL